MSDRVLITGGVGFIGSHIAEQLLQKGFEVRIIDNLYTGHKENIKPFLSDIDLIEADINDTKKMEQALEKIDYVIHLAALADIVPSIKYPEKYFQANVNGSFHLMQKLRTNSIKKIIYAASSSCYGIPEEYPTPETAAIKPMYPYALTKYLAEQIILHWSQVYKIPAISLRLFNVYGPRSRTSGSYGAVFGVFLKQIIENKPLTIVGDGTQTRDFTYVTDVADAFITAMTSEKMGEIYNVGSGIDVSVNKIVSLLGGSKINIPKRPGEPDRTFADIKKIKKDLGWSPKTNVEKGIKNLLDNIDYWKSAPLWTPEKIAEATKEWFECLS